MRCFYRYVAIVYQRFQTFIEFIRFLRLCVRWLCGFRRSVCRAVFMMYVAAHLHLSTDKNGKLMVMIEVRISNCIQVIVE